MVCEEEGHNMYQNMDYGQEEKWYEPLEEIDFNLIKTEMGRDQLACICGAIKRHRPKKIVEVGVAAGGTTVVLYECLRKLNLNACIYSVDLAENYYKDHSKKTGYIAAEYFMNNENLDVRHKFILGRFLPKSIDSIGRDIDMLILDSVHILPGEVLDFLVAFPYLSPNAIVVLHDIALWTGEYIPYTMPTNLLMNVATGRKAVNWTTRGIPDIGFFCIDSDIRNRIKDFFWLFMEEWGYKLSNKEIKIYGDFFEQHYLSDEVEIFYKSVKLNESKNDKPFMEWLSNEYRMFEGIFEHILLYGAGHMGNLFMNNLKIHGGGV